MRRAWIVGAVVVVGLGAVIATITMAPKQDTDTEAGLPYWAYPVATHKWPKPDPNETATIPGSDKTLTIREVNNGFGPPDWFPDDHPPMPDIVAHGRKPDVMACGYCHLPNGHGRPENAALAGLPAAYIVEQVREMREGARHSSTAKMGSINAMMRIAKASNDEEIRAAAEYFSGLKMTKWIRVVETDMAPKTDINTHNMLQMVPGDQEPIGDRILEVPEDIERTELRDSHLGFIAYVPKGSIEKGRMLVKSGAGAYPCAACHGPTYHGNGEVPPLAGRSPSYIVRQLTDFKRGTRNGANAAMMRPEVAKMSEDDMLNIAAYLSSLDP
ncbi:MAG: c-type cytochrome [Alphaproteobacteria bacterium]|nr:c-type cytochrome [Alphaproteobacteria bacterium]